eukprot:SAG11_NODE_783_length_7188_cov_2.206235_3_plen_1691_part_00
MAMQRQGTMGFMLVVFCLVHPAVPSLDVVAEAHQHKYMTPQFNCDSGCLKNSPDSMSCEDDRCVISMPHVVSNCTSTACHLVFYNDLVLNSSGGLSIPPCTSGPCVEQLFVIGSGSNSSLTMHNLSKIVAPLLTVVARNITMDGYALMNATGPTCVSTTANCPIFDNTAAKTLDVVVNSTPGHERNLLLSLSNKSQITGSRIHISVRANRTSTNAPDRTSTNASVIISTSSKIDASARIKHFHKLEGREHCTKPASAYIGGGGYGGYGSLCKTPPDSDVSIQDPGDRSSGGQPCGKLNATCLDGTPGGKPIIDSTGRYAGSGGAGGGQIHIITEVLNMAGGGMVQANGGSEPSSSSTPTPGGGSGGCINLQLFGKTAPLLQTPPNADKGCTGSVCANGGGGSSGGGGGRIMIAAPLQAQAISGGSWSEPMSRMSAVGGESVWCPGNGGSARYAAAGTKYVVDGNGDSLLAVDGIQGSGSEDFTPLDRGHWSQPEPTGTHASKNVFRQISIRNQAIVAISKFVGEEAQISDLELTSGATLQRCTDPICTDDDPGPDAAYPPAASTMNASFAPPQPAACPTCNTKAMCLSHVHNNRCIWDDFTGSCRFRVYCLDRWPDGGGPRDMCLNIGQVNIDGDDTVLVGGNLSIACQSFKIGSDSGANSQIMTQEADDGVYIYAQRAITVARRACIGGDKSHGEEGPDEVLLKCQNSTGVGCNIEVAGDISARIVNLTGRRVSIDHTGTVSGEKVGTDVCPSPIQFTCGAQMNTNGTVGVYMYANETIVSGYVSAGVIFVCPSHFNPTGALTNKVHIRNGQLIVSANGPNGGGCGPELGIGSPDNSATGGGGGAGGAGHGGEGGYGVYKAVNNSFLLESPGGARYDFNKSTIGAGGNPVHVGSGGGGSEQAGAGGGFLGILAETLELHRLGNAYEGAIVARGGDAPKRTLDASSSAVPGGGSGGTVILQTKSLIGNAYILATGGAGSSGKLGAGGGGGGGVVGLNFTQTAAKAVENYTGKIKIDGGVPGRVCNDICQHGKNVCPPCNSDQDANDGENQIAGNVWPSRVPAPPRAPAPPAPPHCPPFCHAERGHHGKVYASKCTLGYSGDTGICKPCAAGKYMNHTSSTGVAGACMKCSPIALTSKIRGPQHHVKLESIAQYSNVTGNQPGAKSIDGCKYRCRAELTYPSCVSPFDRLQNLVGGSLLVLLAVSYLPLLLLLLVRYLLQLIIVPGISDRGPDFDSTSVNTSAGENEYSSLEEAIGSGDAKSKPTFARQLRTLVGVSSTRDHRAEGASLLNSDLSAGVSRLDETAPYNSEIRYDELTYLLVRIYLTGENSISKPWSMPAEPPDELRELGIDLAKYTQIAERCTRLVRWRFGESVYYHLLWIFALPWARSWHKKCRQRHFGDLRNYVQREFEWTVFRDSSMQTKQNSVKLGCSEDATSCYLDVLDYTQSGSTSTNGSGPRTAASLSKVKNRSLRLPQALHLAGTGNYDTPINFDTNDALALAVCRLASKGFVARLNSVLQSLGAALDLSKPDTSLVPLIEFINSENKSTESTVHLEICTLNAAPDCRLLLVVRYKMNSTIDGGSSGTLARDWSEELRQPRYKHKSVSEDDLYISTPSATVIRMLNFAVGLQNPAPLPDQLFPVALILQFTLIGAECLATAVLVTAMVLLSPWQGAILIFTVQPGAILVRKTR